MSIVDIAQRLFGSGKSAEKEQALHFFRQDFTYVCFGYQALFIADEFYHTRHGIRIENGFECLHVSKKFFKHVCAALLQDHSVSIWAKRTPETHSPYDLVAKGSPGNVQAIEDELGGFGSASVAADQVVCVSVNETQPSLLSLSHLNIVDSCITVYEIEDDGSYSLTRDLLTQLEVRSCFLITHTPSKPSSNKGQAMETVDLVDSDEEDRERAVPVSSEEETDSVSLSLQSLLHELLIKVHVQPLTTWTEREQQACLQDLLRLTRTGEGKGEISEQSRLSELHQHCTRLQTLPTIAAVLCHLQDKSAEALTLTFRSLQGSESSEQSPLWMDRDTVSALHLFPAPSAASSTRYRSLYDLLDRCCTAMGKRLLRQWLQLPSRSLRSLTDRQSVVSFFMQHTFLLSQLTEQPNTYLRSFPDLDKLVQRLQKHPLTASASALQCTASSALRDLLEIYRAICRVESILHVIQEQEILEESQGIGGFVRNLQSLVLQSAPLLRLIESVLDADHMETLAQQRSQAAASSSSSSARKAATGGATEGGLSAQQSQSARRLFRDRYFRVSPSLTPALQDAHAQLQRVAEDIIAHYGAVVSAVTAPGDKDKDNLVHLERSEVHGLHFRVTKRQFPTITQRMDKAKLSYRVLSQQKAGCLFQTKELERLEREYTERQDVYDAAQRQVVHEALTVWKTYIPVLRQLARQVAQVDVLLSLAQVAVQSDWVLPTLTVEETTLSGSDRTRVLDLQGLYHPLLRERLGATAVVRSDLHLLAPVQSRVITGPNMGGKSSWLKAAGLAVVLAQIGSAVPCTKATIPLFDRVFLRTGAAESASLGTSSFMTEMTSVADMLRLATPQSLVLIDELGRGTSTADGFGLAWAILEELAVHRQCSLLCATHFHELSRLEDEQPNVFRSLHVRAEVDVPTQQIVMLYELLPGSSDRSYGVHCAQIAGFPAEIISRADALEASLVTTANKRSREGDDEEEEEPVRKKQVVEVV